MNLVDQFNACNKARKTAGLPTLTLNDIARAVTLSKTTVYCILHGTYRSSRAHNHAAEIARCLTRSTPENAAKTPKPIRAARSMSSIPSMSSMKSRAPRATTARVHPTGYLIYRGNHYYAGSDYRSAVVTVSRIRRTEYLRISCGAQSRIVRPINPEGNQLGYLPEQRNA